MFCTSFDHLRVMEDAESPLRRAFFLLHYNDLVVMKPILAKFLLSATSPGAFPTEGPPEFAFLGRSNVGKSSLINSLLGRKLAHVSSTPGKTRTINFIGIYSKPDQV